jgi:polysaccharide deacetylase family protein (PEP-CTERM system associated)
VERGARLVERGPLTLRISGDAGGVLRIEARGDLDVSSTEALDVEFERASRTEVEAIIVDLSGIRSIDSIGMAALGRIETHYGTARFGLVGAPERVERAITLTALEQSPSRADQMAPGAMSIDVEDWFHVENLKGVVPRETWSERQLRVERNTDLMLGLLEQHDVSCTCFILGWVAERCPSLVERIAAAGHEVASHGHGHDLLSNLSPEEFREDVRRSKELLEDLTGQPVRGYRAPSFSIIDWAIPILRDLGFEYDSSVFPTVAHDRYGRLSGVVTGSQVIELSPDFHEVCISCLPVGSRGLPWGGGGYFRLMPYPLFRRGVTRILASGEPYVFYIHPWEIDPDQPRVDGLSPWHGFRHYVGLGRAEERFRSLLAEFRWTTVADVVARSRAHTSGRGPGGLQPSWP